MDNNLSALELSILEDEKKLKEIEESDSKNAESEEVVSEAIDVSEEDSSEMSTEEVEHSQGDSEYVSDEEVSEEDLPPDDSKDNKAWVRLRKSNKDLEEQNRALAERLAKIEGRLEGQSNANQVRAAQEDPDPMPDPEYDKEEYLMWENRQIKKQLEDVRSGLEVRNQESEYNNIKNGLNILENQFKTQTPDYDSAKSFVMEKEMGLLKLSHPGVPEAQLKAHLEQNVIMAANDIYARGEDPAKFLYERAKLLGYSKETEKPVATNKPNINKIKENKRKSASLNGVGAVDTNQEYSPEHVVNMALGDLAGMSDAEWAALEAQARNG